MSINEQFLKNIFEDDGSYGDIYIHEVNLEDWEKLLELINQSGWMIKFLKDGEEVNPEYYGVKEIFQMRKDVVFLFSISFKEVIINFHFFNENEIEFDIFPREINTLEQINAVFDFMKILSKFFNKNIFLTPENSPEYPYLSINPHGQITVYPQ